MRIRVSTGWLVAVFVWLVAAAAQAQEPRVVVLDFVGKGGDKARIQVIRALRGQVEFETQSAAKKVLVSKKLSASSVQGRAAVARELSLDYVIWGNARGRGSSTRAKIRFAGPKGREIASRSAGPPGTAKGNAKIQDAARALLRRAVVVAPPASPASKAPAETTELEEPIVIELDTEASTPARTIPEPEPEASEVEEPVVIEVQTGPDEIRYAPYVSILGGAGGRTRTIEIDVEDGEGGTATRTYESSVYLDIVFRLEVRPLAKHPVRGARGLALEADGDFGIGLETQPPGSTQKLDTKAWRVLGQLGYFHRFRDGELGGLVGVGFDRLAIEPNATIPSIDYLFLRVGPAYRHFFLDRALYLRVDGAFRYPFSYGDLSDTFGEAKGFGFDAGLSLGGELDVGFVYVARFSLDYFKPQFDGFAAGMIPPVPGAASGRDATDLAINFHILVGWAF